MTRGLTLVAAFCVATFAYAQTADAQLKDIVDGTYVIKGKKGKKKYKGTLTLLAGNGAIFGYKVVNGKASRVVGVKQGNMLVLAGGKNGVVVFKHDGTSSFEGFWTMNGSDGAIGSEKGVSTETGGAFGGEFVITGTNPDGKKYKGELYIDEEYDKYELVWKLGKSKVKGWGLVDDNMEHLVGGFGGKAANVFRYTLASGELGGMNALPYKKASTETLTLAGAVVELQQFAAAVCACKGKRCAQAGVTTFRSVFLRLQNVQLAKNGLDKIRKASEKATKCLMKRGISGEQIKKALQ